MEQKFSLPYSRKHKSNNTNNIVILCWRLCTSFDIFKYVTFRKLDLLTSSGVKWGNDPTQLGPLGGANVDHYACQV
jgi:hypothetical protein